MRLRQQQHGGFGQIVRRGLIEARPVDRIVQRLANANIVQRLAPVIQVDLNAVQGRAGDRDQVLGPLHHRLLLRRQEVDEIILPGDDRT